MESEIFFNCIKTNETKCGSRVIRKSRYTQVSRTQFLDIVLRRVKARDDDSEYDKIRNVTEIARKEILEIRNEGDKIFTRIWLKLNLKLLLLKIRQYMTNITKHFNNSDVL